jgi:phosphatidylinositol alpha-1,6-mannosyltransferase
LRILALVTDAFGAMGGIAEYNRQLLTTMAAADGVEEVVVLPRGGAPCPARPYSKLKVLAPHANRIDFAAAALKAAVLERTFGLIFCGHIYMSPLGRLLSLATGAPLWIQVHGIDAWQPLSALHRRAIETATLVTSSSRYTRSRLLEWTDLDPIRVKVLPCTVDPRFTPGPKPGYLIERHGLMGRRVLLSVSRLDATERYKGQDRVIEVMPQILDHAPDAVYLIIGEGDDRPRLEALAAKVGVADNILFLGHISNEELPDYMRLSDVYVMPSTGEGFGIVFLEAMASGARVVGGNRDGSLDPLKDGAAGSAIDPENPQAITSAVCAALDQPSGSLDHAGSFSLAHFADHVTGLLQTLSGSCESVRR